MFLKVIKENQNWTLYINRNCFEDAVGYYNSRPVSVKDVSNFLDELQMQMSKKLCTYVCDRDVQSKIINVFYIIDLYHQSLLCK